MRHLLKDRPKEHQRNWTNKTEMNRNKQKINLHNYDLSTRELQYPFNQTVPRRILLTSVCSSFSQHNVKCQLYNVCILSVLQQSSEKDYFIITNP